jgi:streptogramin lyase
MTGITAGPDGNLWFGETGGGKIGHLTDLQTNARKTYTNKDGAAAAPVQDTAARPCS